MGMLETLACYHASIDDWKDRRPAHQWRPYTAVQALNCYSSKPYASASFLPAASCGAPVYVSSLSDRRSRRIWLGGRAYQSWDQQKRWRASSRHSQGAEPRTSSPSASSKCRHTACYSHKLHPMVDYRSTRTILCLSTAGMCHCSSRQTCQFNRCSPSCCRKGRQYCLQAMPR